jgi:hypothetical protein
MIHPDEEPRLETSEQRSRIKLTRNAKGDPQWEISVVDGADFDEVDRIRKIALAQFEALLDAFFPGPAPSA